MLSPNLALPHKTSPHEILNSAEAASLLPVSASSTAGAQGPQAVRAAVPAQGAQTPGLVGRGSLKDWVTPKLAASIGLHAGSTHQVLLAAYFKKVKYLFWWGLSVKIEVIFAF